MEEASAMLQRLPSLGRIGAESQDRQFVDMFILDGLRAKDITALPDNDETQRRSAFGSNWLNPLGVLGQKILAEDIKLKFDTYRQFAARANLAKNPTLAGDVIAALARVSSIHGNLQGLNLIGANFSELDLVDTSISNFTISEAVIDRLVLPNSPPSKILIQKSVAGKVSGAASYTGLPSWVQLDLVDQFDTVQTVAQIKRTGLSPALEVLVAVLKKTFKQKGSGRKEEALLRGFGTGASKKLASAVLRILLRDDIVTRHKGDEGWIYSPNRNEIARITTLLTQLRSSSDPIWAEVQVLRE